MNKKIGLAIAVVGILVILGTIFYQAKTEQQALFMLPIGLGITFLGVFATLRKNK